MEFDEGFFGLIGPDSDSDADAVNLPRGTFEAQIGNLTSRTLPPNPVLGREFATINDRPVDFHLSWTNALWAKVNLRGQC